MKTLLNKVNFLPTTLTILFTLSILFFAFLSYTENQKLIDILIKF